MSKVIITKANDMNFETPDGSKIDGLSLHIVVQGDESGDTVEKVFIQRANVAGTGFKKEMVSNLFDEDSEIVDVDVEFTSVNGKAKIAKLTM
jgi:hypothetical protein